MRYLYWICAGLIVAAGIGFSIYMSDEPEILSKVEYTHFSDLLTLSEKVSHEFDQEIRASSLVMLGVMPGRKIDLEFWRVFLDQKESTGLRFQAVLIDPILPHAQEFFPGAMRMDLQKEISRFIEGAKNARNQNIRMAVIVPSIYSSQVLRDSPVDLIKKTTDLKPLSFSVMGFPRSSEEEAAMEFPCVMGSNDRHGTGALGCLVLQKARLNYQQKSKPDFYEGLIDRVGERDYLILLNGK